jgi:hypothetical protein
MAELTPEQIKLEQQRLDLLQKQNTAAKELEGTYKNIEKSGRRLTDDEKELLEFTKDIASFSSTIEKSIQKRVSGNATSKDLSKSIKELEYDKLQNERKYQDITQKINTQKATALSKFTDLSRRERSIQTTLTDELRAQDDILDEIERLKRAGGPTAAAAIAAKRDELKLNKEAISDLQTGLKKAIEQKNQQKELFKNLKASEEAHRKIIEEQEKELVLAKEALKQKQKEEVLNEVKKRLRLDELKEMFTLAGIFKMIIDAGLRFNKTSVEIGKNLGYGADNANRVTESLVDIANHSGNVNVTLKNAAEAMSELNTATGGVAEYSADTLETQILLTKQFGLTGEEAAGIYKFSTLSGKASSQINEEMAGAFASTRNMVKGSANFKTTMAEVSKTSGQLAANFQNNPAEITKAVVQAQALGTSLEQVAKQGETLLNFESSIENELKAELLTGKQLNLERARAAALAGDQIALAEELNKNVGTLEDFQKMNVLQQKSLAEAMGLTADQLADQLRKQKIAQEQGKSLVEITKEEALEAEKRQAVQDKFNAAILKLQDFIGNLVAGPVAILLEMLTDALVVIGKILYPIQLLFDLTKAIGSTIGGWMDKLGIVGTILKGIASVAIIFAAYAAYASLAAIPVIGPVLGGVAAAAITAGGFAMLNSKKGDDVLSEGGYGKRTLLAPEGAIKLNDKDTVIAGTNLGGKSPESLDKGNSEILMPQIDLTPMIAAINEVKAAVDRLYNKDQSINMDGKKVGTTLVQGSYKVA